jgi:hypothetical protein
MRKKLRQPNPSQEFRCGTWIRKKWEPCDFYGEEGTCSLGHNPGAYCSCKARAREWHRKIQKIMSGTEID